ncbi:MAG: SRPBCC family protein [Gemmatimonadetes bacterium]|nr:SRPBCC family protein [Gemmatimonadota bacterium]
MGFLKKLVILAALVVGGVWWYGRSLPREHRLSSAITLVQPQDTVWRVVRSVGSYYAWWDDVKAVRRLEFPRESYEQNLGAAGMLSVEVVREEPPRRFVTRILNLNQEDYGGTWTYTVRLTEAGTEVMITEDGWVESPFYRVYANLRGHRRRMNSFLGSLGAHFGETVTPRERN